MSEKKKKQPRPKARLPRGFADRQAHDIRAADEMMATIRAVYERYGFDPVETPMIEYTDALGKFLPDQDRPNEGVFSLQDDDEQWMSLRYDLTAPLARHVAENINTIQLPFRTYRAGWVFRNEKPGPGRFRQFMQFDADTVGAPGVQADAEMCMMMADTMEALGIARGDYVIRVNNRKVLDGVMEAIGIGGDEHAAKRLTVLRAIDKLDKFGVEGVAPSCWARAARTRAAISRKGAGLTARRSTTCVASATTLPRSRRPTSRCGAISGRRRRNGGPAYDEVRKDFDFLGRSERLEAASTNSSSSTGCIAAGGMSGRLRATDRIRIDPSVVRGLEYYTGPVYEAELLFEIPNEKGEIVRFGSVGGGGRYDGLVKRFTGQDVPATGFSIGVSRLATALKNLGKLGRDEVLAPVVVCVMDRDTASLGRYQRFTQELRNAGIRAEMYQGNPKNFGNQLKYADRRGAPLAIIQGGDERARGEVQIKDLVEGKRLSAEIDDNVTWRESRPAQVSVPESELVAKVRELMERQAEDRRRAAGG